MDKQYIITGKYFSSWHKAMEYEVKDGAVMLSEQLRGVDGKAVITGRTIEIRDYDSLMSIMKKLTGQSDLSAALIARSEAGKLEIDNLFMMCMRHELDYSLSGSKLFSAYCHYLKDAKEVTDALKSKYWGEYSRAYEMLNGLFGKYGKNEPEALKILKELGSKGFVPAKIELIEYYKRMGQYGRAAKILAKGPLLKNSNMLLEAASLYENGADFVLFTDALGEPDIENAVKCCKAAFEKGNSLSAILLYRYIQEGYIENGSEYYIPLLKMAAKTKLARRNIRPIAHRKPTEGDYMLKNALSLMQNNRLYEAVDAFEYAIKNGETRAYSYLADCLTRAGRRCEAAKAVAEGINSGDNHSFFVAAELCEKGVDLIGFTDELKAPDYASAGRYLSSYIEKTRFSEKALRKLQSFIDRGLVDDNSLSGVVKDKLSLYK